jgi:hypothetical protein
VRRTFRVQRVYVCRFDLTDLDSWPRPSVPCGIETHFIAFDSDADALAAQGCEDFRDRFPRARGSLETGAVALCAYWEKKLAHVGWIARDSRAKWRFDDVLYPVDFELGEACLGSVFTFLEYRG